MYSIFLGKHLPFLLHLDHETKHVHLNVKSLPCVCTLSSQGQQPFQTSVLHECQLQHSHTLCYSENNDSMAETGSPEYSNDPGHDEDVYEDAGDLEFQNRNSDGSSNLNDRMFLVRLPVELWQAWSNIDDDQEIQIGRIRKWEEDETKIVGQGRNRRTVTAKANRFKMLLSANIPQQRDMPKEYDLTVPDSAVMNTFLFTEQDLPSYRLKNKVKAEQQKAGIPQNLIRSSWASQSEGQGDGPNDNGGGGGASNSRNDRKNRRFNPYRKAVPKKTTILGRIRHELNCAPVSNAESRQQLHKLVRKATEPKRVPQLMPISEIRSSGGATSDKFEGFIVSATVFLHGEFRFPFSFFFFFFFFFFLFFILWFRHLTVTQKSAAKPVPKAKKQEAKATRVSQGELRDMLHASFKKYNYWSMKALRQETQQPEAYLRENLELIADLHKSGSFANHWSLKDEYRSSIQIAGSSDVAPDTHVEGDGSEFEDDE